MTLTSKDDRECLKFRLEGSGKPVGSWGHEYVMCVLAYRAVCVCLCISCYLHFRVVFEYAPFTKCVLALLYVYVLFAVPVGSCALV